jgi:hypothetical protein
MIGNKATKSLGENQKFKLFDDRFMMFDCDYNIISTWINFKPNLSTKEITLSF